MTKYRITESKGWGRANFNLQKKGLFCWHDFICNFESQQKAKEWLENYKLRCQEPQVVKEI